ncbi:tetratricopeptide repeat protein [Micromonospora sp. H61]|uniref:tetratricopeptide repeat protein n=1 Tax=Micromonospora sp. H61 TaxID=2824888 RepID=UPI001B38874D|nr:tetratricopeptide repeat protein [Micromonospora sp. H61]MBQ0990718.1 tetratricopeptide repeat protein [Micromonospora sp. H61]
MIQVSHVEGSVTVGTELPAYRVVPANLEPVALSPERARAQPSRLLLARHQIVPFAGRSQTLNDLAMWMRSPEPVAVRLIHAAGGQGKSRLAAEMATRHASAGWTVWQATLGPAPQPQARALDLPGRAVLAIVDYADRWPFSTLLALLSAMQQCNAKAGVVVRALLLARSAKHWWPAVADRAEADLQAATDELALPSLVGGNCNPDALFIAAADRFARALGSEHAGGWPVPDLGGPAFARLLAIHMSALATVEALRHGDSPPTSSYAVSAYLLRREQRYWHEMWTRETPLSTLPQTMHRAVFMATLIGALPRLDARRALVGAALATDVTAADKIIDDHSVCHPPTDPKLVMEALHPDRLGEDFIALSVPGHSHHDAGLTDDWTQTAPAAFLAGHGKAPVSTVNAISVLVETARRWPHVATRVLYPLLRAHPHLALAAGGATVVRLTGLPSIDMRVLEALEPLLPDGPHLDFDVAAAAVSDRLTHHRLARTSDPAARAHLHNMHSLQLAKAARHHEALLETEEAINLYREVTEKDVAALPQLAEALNTRGVLLSALDQPQEALAPTEEATGIMRLLAQADPATWEPMLAAALTNLAVRMSELDRWPEALPPDIEALEIYRRLAKSDPLRWEPQLAMSLLNNAVRWAAFNQLGEALAVARESVAIRRRLATAEPAAHLAGLARSLINLGAWLFESKQATEALSPIREAEGIFRQLATTHPAVHLADLATSLTALGNVMVQSERAAEALPFLEEAVVLCRSDPKADAEGSSAMLILALSLLGAALLEAGEPERGLATLEQAAEARRIRAASGSATSLSELASSLANLGLRRVQSGQQDQGLDAVEEAIEVRRRLIQLGSDGQLRELALLLWAYAELCVGSELRFPQAQQAVVEAISIYLSPAVVDPAYRHRLLGMYRTKATILDELGQTSAANALWLIIDSFSVDEEDG